MITLIIDVRFYLHMTFIIRFFLIIMKEGYIIFFIVINYLDIFDFNDLIFIRVKI